MRASITSELFLMASQAPGKVEDTQKIILKRTNKWMDSLPLQWKLFSIIALPFFMPTSSPSTLPSADLSGGGEQSLHLSLLRNWSMPISSPQSTIPTLGPYVLPKMTNKFHLKHWYPQVGCGINFSRRVPGLCLSSWGNYRCLIGIWETEMVTRGAGTCHCWGILLSIGVPVLAFWKRDVPSNITWPSPFLYRKGTHGVSLSLYNRR